MKAIKNTSSFYVFSFARTLISTFFNFVLLFSPFARPSHHLLLRAVRSSARAHTHTHSHTSARAHTPTPAQFFPLLSASNTHSTAARTLGHVPSILFVFFVFSVLFYFPLPPITALSSPTPPPPSTSTPTPNTWTPPIYPPVSSPLLIAFR